MLKPWLHFFPMSLKLSPSSLFVIFFCSSLYVTAFAGMVFGLAFDGLGSQGLVFWGHSICTLTVRGLPFFAFVLYGGSFIRISKIRLCQWAGLLFQERLLCRRTGEKIKYVPLSLCLCSILPSFHPLVS